MGLFDKKKKSNQSSKFRPLIFNVIVIGNLFDEIWQFETIIKRDMRPYFVDR